MTVTATVIHPEKGIFLGLPTPDLVWNGVHSRQLTRVEIDSNLLYLFDNDGCSATLERDPGEGPLPVEELVKGKIKGTFRLTATSVNGAEILGNKRFSSTDKNVLFERTSE